jgi:hypothetical protein
MASRKRKDRKKKRPIGRPNRPADPLQALARRHEGDAVVIATPPGEEKMSGVIIEFLDPYMDKWKDLAQLRTLVAFGAIAWNAALLPEDDREQSLRIAEAMTPPEGRSLLRAVLSDLVRRKFTHFASDTRAIIDYQVTMTPTGPYVAIASSRPPPPAHPGVPPE